MNYIRDDLLEYGYLQIDQIYEGMGGNTDVLANAINEGSGLINYLGHGEDQSYYSIPFYQSNVYGLQNQGKLPFVCNCACLIGNFAPQTCLAEYWLRATDYNGEPIGAIAFLASSVSKWIGDPEYGQDEFVDLLCAEAKQTIGGLWYNCINYAMEVTGEYDEFCCWNVFGDPSLSVRTKVPQEIEIDTSEAGILLSLSKDNELLASGYTDDTGYLALDVSELPQVPGEITLTASGLNKITLIEELQMIPPEGEYLYLDEYAINSGDDDVINAGETVFIDLLFTNYGNETAENVELAMLLQDEYIAVTDSVESLGDIAHMESIDLQDILCFEVADDIEFAHPFCAEIILTSTEEEWRYELWFSSYAPDGLWISPGELNIELTLGDSLTRDLIISNYLQESIDVDLRVEPVNMRDISGSYLSCDTADFLPGTVVEWVFTAHNLSIDNEWIGEIEIDFPEEVEVLEVSAFTGASGGDLVTESELGSGANVCWTGFSTNGWGFLHSGETAACTVLVDIEYENLDSLAVSWLMGGDGFGEMPHETTGDLRIYNPLPWIYIHDIQEVIAPADFCVIPIDFATELTDLGTYSCQVIVSDSREQTIIPVTLEVLPLSSAEPEEICPMPSLQIFPNPFNPTINMTYKTDKAGIVDLNIYNVKGQKVAGLVNCWQAAGEHIITWEAEEQSSGIYFIRLKINGSSQMQKAILLK